MLVANWQKSSYCGEGESCVHVSATDTTVRLTESSDPSGAILHTTPAAFAALTQALKTGSPSPYIDVTHTTDGQVRIGGVVTTTPEKWDAFVLGVRAGEFDHVSVHCSLVRQKPDDAPAGNARSGVEQQQQEH